jgi:hypothetical protein
MVSRGQIMSMLSKESAIDMAHGSGLVGGCCPHCAMPVGGMLAGGRLAGGAIMYQGSDITKRLMADLDEMAEDDPAQFQETMGRINEIAEGILEASGRRKKDGSWYVTDLQDALEMGIAQVYGADYVPKGAQRGRAQAPYLQGWKKIVRGRYIKGKKAEIKQAEKAVKAEQKARQKQMTAVARKQLSEQVKRLRAQHRAELKIARADARKLQKERFKVSSRGIRESVGERYQRMMRADKCLPSARQWQEKSQADRDQLWYECDMPEAGYPRPPVIEQRFTPEILEREGLQRTADERERQAILAIGRDEYTAMDKEARRAVNAVRRQAGLQPLRVRRRR